MSNARNLARLLPNTSGQLPDANLAAIAAGKVSGQLADANMSSGSVLQVVQGIKSDVSTISNSGPSGWSNIPGLSASITPSSQTSKILVMVALQGGPTAANYYMSAFRTLRNGSAIGVGNPTSGYESATVINQRVPSDVNAAVNVSYQLLDSPATTSSVTYQVQIAGEGGTSFRINTSGSDNNSQSYSWRGSSTITLIEVAA